MACFYGVGCLLSALLVAGSYSFYTVPAMGLLLLILPAVASVLFARASMPEPPEHEPAGLGRSDARNAESCLRCLLALLLFF